MSLILYKKLLRGCEAAGFPPTICNKMKTNVREAFIISTLLTPAERRELISASEEHLELLSKLGHVDPATKQLLWENVRTMYQSLASSLI